MALRAFDLKSFDVVCRARTDGVVLRHADYAALAERPEDRVDVEAAAALVGGGVLLPSARVAETSHVL